MTTYKALGTTDDVTTCELCGKPELKGTVILAILDRDGNTEETVYAGSTCAARRVGGRTTAKHIRDYAAASDYRRNELVTNSQGMVDFYGPLENDWQALTKAYLQANAGFFRNHPEAYVNALQMAQDCLARHRKCVATHGLSML